MKKKIIIPLIIIVVISLAFIVIKLLNKELDNSTYTIITDFRYITMQNDGGSNTNIYYEFNSNKKTIKKLEDKYVGFQGYEYQGNEIYNKTINDKITRELKDLLDNLISKEDINNPKNYSPYIIKKKDKEKSIYNKESINSLKEKLQEIDDY